MSDFDTDAVIVGAGAIGLACGYALAQRGLSVIVLESSARIGEGISSRNSEVIHAGLHYATGSLRARLCVQGRRMLYSFLDAHGVPYRRCGKLIVATCDEDVVTIEKLFKQGQINDVENLKLIDSAEALKLEPKIRCQAALLSPESGIFDSHAYMLALQGEIESKSGHVVCESSFSSAALRKGGGFLVSTYGTTETILSSRYLILSPGLGAQEVAEKVEGFPPYLIPKRYLGKGVYFKLRGKAPFDRLVYPPPIPGALGTHYRKNLGGQAVFGPDLAFVDTIDFSIDESRAMSFYENIRRYWPALPDNSLEPDYAGIRPKIHGRDEPQPDFRVDGPELHGLPGLVTLFGIESPGLTSSLAIGNLVADQLLTN